MTKNNITGRDVPAGGTPPPRLIYTWICDQNRTSGGGYPRLAHRISKSQNTHLRGSCGLSEGLGRGLVGRQLLLLYAILGDTNLRRSQLKPSLLGFTIIKIDAKSSNVSDLLHIPPTSHDSKTEHSQCFQALILLGASWVALDIPGSLLEQISLNYWIII